MHCLWKILIGGVLLLILAACGRAADVRPLSDLAKERLATSSSQKENATPKPSTPPPLGERKFVLDPLL